jgi:methionyl-tRNA formyltransferase
MRIVFTGSGEFGVPTLQALLAAGHEIPLVVTQPDRPSGRGRKVSPTPVGQFAAEHGLPLLRTEDFNRETIPDCDVMLVIAFGQKIGVDAVARPKLGCLNLHASLLPRLRGAAPVNWAILNGDSVTGNSVIRLAQRMDGGAVLAQSSLPIGPNETAGELHDRLAADGPQLVLQVLRNLENATAIEKPQDEKLATAAPKLSREFSHIDWSASADAIVRKIRGLFPWPGCRARLVDAAGEEQAKLTLVRAKVGEGEGPRWQAGEINLSGDVAVGPQVTQAVQILQVKPDGGRIMELTDYRRGHPWRAGMRLEST